MLTATDILWGMVLPLVAAAVGVGVTLLPPVRSRARLAGALVVIGVGAGWLLSYASLPGQVNLSRFPPLDSLHWLFWAGIAVVTLAAVDAATRRSRWWARAPVVLVLSGAIAWLLLRPIIRYEWTTAVGAAWVGGIAVAALVAWLAADRSLVNGPRAAAPVALAVLAAGTAVVLMTSGSVKLGQLALALAFALAPVVVTSLLGPRVPAPRALALPVVVPLAGLVIYGHFFAELTMIDAALLLSAPVLLWAGTVVPLRRGWQRATLAIVLSAIPVMVAAVRSVAGFVEDQRQPDPYEMYY